MVKKLLGLTLLIFTISCTCQRKVDEAHTFKINLSPSTGIKDPLLNLDQERLKVLSLVYETLLAYAPNAQSGGDLFPVLLSELPTLSADQLTYTFKLKNTPFHSNSKLESGRRVTSRDVIMSLLRGVKVEDASNYGNLLTGIIEGLASWVGSEEAGEWHGKNLPSGFKIISDSEFSIRLLRKYPDFLALLTLPAFSIQPVEAMEGGKLLAAVGTGPYHFEEASVGGANWNLLGSEQLKFSYVVVTQSLEPAVVKASDYSALNLKLASSLVDIETVSLKGLPEHTLNELRVRRLEMLLFNIKDPVVKALGADFRAALLSSLDSASIMNQMYRGFALNSNQFIPPGVEGALDESPLKLLSKEAALKKIKKALGKKKLNIIYPETAQYWISQLQNNLEELGDYFDFEATEVSTYLERIEKGEFQIAPLSWEGDLPEATNFLQLYYSGSQKNTQNLSGYKSATFDAAFEKLSKLFPTPARKTLAEEAHRLVLKDLPALPLGYKKDFVVLGKRATGLNTKAFGATALKDFLVASDASKP
ncbi:MAG: ABC transporter substrate-binding protein [Bdellovibrionota bacterium]